MFRYCPIDTKPVKEAVPLTNLLYVLETQLIDVSMELSGYRHQGTPQFNHLEFPRRHYSANHTQFT